MSGLPGYGQQAGDGMPSAAEIAASDSVFRLKKAENDAYFKVFSFEVHPSVGYAASRYHGLNGLLQPTAYPAVKSHGLSYGGGGSLRIYRVVLSLEAVLYDFDHTEQNRKTELTSSNTLIRLGYAWFTPNYAHSFTPSIGLGSSGADVTLTDLNAASGSTAGALLGGAPYSNTLHYRNKNLALGLAYEHYPSSDMKRRNVLGIHLNYLARLGEGRYYAHDFKQSVSGPAIDPLLFNIRMVTGFLF
ncbi:hypothetical protein LJY25_16830 [Hymenobacter sp. BT175]|uniref:hypothetical protein n=1 Tax=Hymenobacter translucens TaxID=2886507 RepID=UPI001D0E1FC3|nr:hypothetical protein [Hymenobacter translucens]MCC2548117.1 hypothetical protein [Hymenobacter translucens]